ncbi:MAG: hypothetical protein ACAI38_12295 [Myxococcota bacterium]
MEAFKRNFLRHVEAVAQWMTTHRAGGGINPVTLHLEITCDGTTHRFTPQFFELKPDGTVSFARDLKPSVIGFVSWLPYPAKGWPIAQDKAAFKAFARTHNIPTPDSWADTPLAAPFIVKTSRSSLGQGQRGPFAAGTPVQLAPGEFCERFIFGSLVKAWYWDAELVVAEHVAMPMVQGDGQQTLGDLVAARLDAGVALPRHFANVAKLQGLDPESVLTDRQVAFADYQYMSPMNPAISIDHDVRKSIAGTRLEAELQSAGRACFDAIPAELRPGVAFSLDAVLDQEGRVWFLEANCNPLLHPSFYRHMLDALFARPSERAP